MKKSLAVWLVIATGLAAVAGAGIGLPLLRSRTIQSWTLPDGTVVEIHRKEHDPPGRDSIKILKVTLPNGTIQEYPFAQWHAGYQRPELRISDDNTVIWIVDRQAKPYIGPSLVLSTRSFRDERESHPPQVGVDAGRIVPESGSR